MERFRWCIFIFANNSVTPWVDSLTEWGSKKKATQELHKVPGKNLAIVQVVGSDGTAVAQWERIKFREWRKVEVTSVLEPVPSKKRTKTKRKSAYFKITNKLIRQIAVEVWKKYPQALTDPYYQLGELTLELVNQEIKQRLDDLRRGIVVKQAALKDYFN